MGRDYEYCLELQKKVNDFELVVSRLLGQVVNYMYIYYMLGFILFCGFYYQLDLFLVGFFYQYFYEVNRFLLILQISV